MSFEEFLAAGSPRVTAGSAADTDAHYIVNPLGTSSMSIAQSREGSVLGAALHHLGRISQALRQDVDSFDWEVLGDLIPTDKEPLDILQWWFGWPGIM
jgi:hypothetical protein